MTEQTADTGSVNPNVAVTNTETINAGSAITSFDEIESVQKQDVDSKKPVENTEEKTEKVDTKPKEGKNKVDDSLETKDEGKTDKKEDKSEKPDAPRRGKSIKFKVGDQDIPLDANALVKVTVDGKTEEIPIQEVLNGFSGSTAVRKRFSELDQQKQTFQKAEKEFNYKQQQFTNNIREINELGKTDPELAVYKAVEHIGGDPEAFVQNLYGVVQKKLEKLLSMTEEERRIYEAEQKAELYKRQSLNAREKYQAANVQQGIAGRISELSKQHNISDEEFDKVADELLGLKKAGKIDQKITPDLVAQVIVDDRNQSIVKDVVSEIRPDLDEENRQVLHEALITVVRKEPKITQGDSETAKRVLIEVAETAFGIKAAKKNLSSKLEKNDDLTKPKSPASKHNGEAWGFDQL